MAKFTGKNIEFKTGQKAIFGDADNSAIYWDEVDVNLVITTTASGVDPIKPGHLVTRRYLEGYVDTVTSGVGRSAQYDIPDATDSFTVIFSTPMDSVNYYIVGSLENQLDADPAKYGFNIYNTTVNGFSVELSDITDSENYKFNYVAVNEEVGSVGIPGPQGDTGDTGIQGDQGDQGIPGEGVATTSGSAGQYDIPNSTEFFTVDFTVDMLDTDYFVVGTIENTDDIETAKYGFNIVNTTVGGFDVDLTDITDSANYKFNWIVVANPLEVVGVAVPGPQGDQGIQGIQGETGATGSGISEVVDDTTPQLGGDLELNDHNIVLTSTPGTNQTANGMVVPMTVDVNDQGFGAPLYMASDGNLEQSSADSSATMPCVAMALETGTGTKDCCLLGFVRNDSWNWTSLGGVEGLIYASTTSGVLTQTLVSGSGQQVQTVGYATHADRMYFNPQLPMVEIA